jgi:hypothetical protein
VSGVNRQNEPKTIPGRVLVSVLIIFLWVLAMLGILYISPFQSEGLTIMLWAAWAGILILIVKYLVMKREREFLD